MRRLLTLLTLMLAAPVLGAATQHYGASLTEAGWRLNAGPDRCELVQTVPGYGRALFRREAGRSLEFAVQTPIAPTREERATLVTVPALWQHGGEPREIGLVQIRKARLAVVAGRATALRLLYELRRGRVAQLLHYDWAEGFDQVVVSISPVHLGAVLAEFQACMARLPEAVTVVAAARPAPAAAPAPGPGGWRLRLEPHGADALTRAAVVDAAEGLLEVQE